jgi:hypothetical protein
MLRKDFILCKARSLLSEFMAAITANADKPRRGFVRQAVRVVLLSGFLVVMEYHLNRAKRVIARENRGVTCFAPDQ